MYSDERQKTIIELIKLMTDNELARNRANIKDAIVLDRESLSDGEWILSQFDAEINHRTITIMENESCSRK